MDRTAFEVHEVMTAPLAIELQVGAEAIVKVINDLPPELRPVGKRVADALIDAIEQVLDNVVEQLPGLPKYLRASAVRAKALRLEQEVQHDPDASNVKKAEDFIKEIDASVDPFTSPIFYPHRLTNELVNEQLSLVKKYINEHVIG